MKEKKKRAPRHSGSLVALLLHSITALFINMMGAWGPSLKGDEAPCKWEAILMDLLATDAVAAHTAANGSNFNFGTTIPLLRECCLSLYTTSLPLLTQ